MMLLVPQIATKYTSYRPHSFGDYTLAKLKKLTDFPIENTAVRPGSKQASERECPASEVGMGVGQGKKPKDTRKKPE